MVQDLVLKAETAEPAIGKVDPDFTAKRSFQANPKHIADD
jgi:hypothetical protein